MGKNQSRMKRTKGDKASESFQISYTLYTGENKVFVFIALVINFTIFLLSPCSFLPRRSNSLVAFLTLHQLVFFTGDREYCSHQYIFPLIFSHAVSRHFMSRNFFGLQGFAIQSTANVFDDWSRLEVSQSRAPLMHTRLCKSIVLFEAIPSSFSYRQKVKSPVKRLVFSQQQMKSEGKCRTGGLNRKFPTLRKSFRRFMSEKCNC